MSDVDEFIADFRNGERTYAEKNEVEALLSLIDQRDEEITALRISFDQLIGVLELREQKLVAAEDRLDRQQAVVEAAKRRRAIDCNRSLTNELYAVESTTVNDELDAALAALTQEEPDE
jgi:hypothetical protein